MPKLWTYQRLKYFKITKRLYSSEGLPNPKLPMVSSKNDIIGPPDEISNLRPIIIAKAENETEIEKKYRIARENTQNWNQKFWLEHNTQFIKERKQFQQKLQEQSNKSITADEMSVFYKNFLDKNWKRHLTYNISWYKQNIKILFLELRVRLSKFKF